MKTLACWNISHRWVGEGERWRPAHWLITIIQDDRLLDRFLLKILSERACWISPLMKRCLRECYLLGKAHKHLCLGKCIGIARDWISKSGRKSYGMYYGCMFMCMCILNWCMFDVWCMMQPFFFANASFMICICNVCFCGNQCFLDVLTLRPLEILLWPWNWPWCSWYPRICNVPFFLSKEKLLYSCDC